MAKISEGEAALTLVMAAAQALTIVVMLPQVGAAVVVAAAVVAPAVVDPPAVVALAVVALAVVACLLTRWPAWRAW